MHKLSWISLALACVAAVATPANAGFVLFAQEAGVNGGAITPIGVGADFTNASFTGVYGDFTLTVNGAASTNAAAKSSLLTATVSLLNNTTAFHTINLFASQNNYTLPLGNFLAVESGLAGTVNTGTLTGSGVFLASLDANNALLGSSFTNGPQSVAFSGSTFDTGSATGIFNRTNPQYSITSQITATVSGGGEGNFASHINVAPVSAPPSLALMLTGGVTGVILRWLRRRGISSIAEPA